MSVHVMSWVMRNSRATLGTRLVILALSDYANDQGGSCWPSIKTICKDTLLSERQVQYALRTLEQMGEITVEEKGGGRRSTRYRILMGEVQNLHPPNNGRGATHCTPEVQPTAPYPSVEPPEEQTLAAAPRKRDEIWDSLAEIFGTPTTRSAETRRGKVVSSLRRAGATPDEVFGRARRWALHYPNATMTDTALESHWDTLPRKPLRRIA